MRQVFQQIGSDVQERWEVIDANRTQDEVENELWTKVEPLTKGLQDELKIMWASRAR